MTVLRSREIVSPTLPNFQLPPQPFDKFPIIDPQTPAKTMEPPSNNLQSSSPTPPSSLLGFASYSTTTIRRRSLRLASKSNSSGKTFENVSTVSSRKRENVACSGDSNSVEGETEEGSFDLEGMIEEVRVSPDNDDAKMSAEDVVIISATAKPKGKRKLGNDFDSPPPLKLMGDVNDDDESVKGFLSLRSGTKIAKRRLEGINGSADDDDDEDVGMNIDIDKERESVLDHGESGNRGVANELERDQRVEGRRRSVRGEKGKGKSVNEEALMIPNGVEALDLNLRLGTEKSTDNAVSDAVSLRENVAETILIGSPNNDGNGSNSSKIRGRLSKEEKGKGKMVENAFLLYGTDVMELDSEPKLENLIDKINEFPSSNNLDAIVASKVEMERQVIEINTKRMDEIKRRDDEISRRAEEDRRRGYKERFRSIARKNASRFAHFAEQEEEENQVMDEAMDLPSTGTVKESEDWPGPFSTAMKIIRDRKTTNGNEQQQNSSMDKVKPTSFIWVPKKDHQCGSTKKVVPSLHELSMRILAKNADAITSLDSVPDVLRHNIAQLLCDSRRMNGHFLELLVSGSPTEVRVRDCSWLTEEEFTRTFEGCKTDKLMVLQLDQCGRCLPDYILLTTLARSLNSMPALTTISLKGACRLSDAGLSALVSSAPALRSINLSQCSLLTFKAIGTLADSLGMVLRELYLDDCQTIDPMLILPALKKLERLEVLSLAGIQTVSDRFIHELISVRGPNMRELVLADCVKLTDSSLRVIAETCSGLCALDLVNLCKLTDAAIGYLANGCRTIQTLKLCRNSFSDEAIAAYLETSGDSLVELSLNNVIKVGQNTAISLAKCSRKLLSLDLSWCRSLTDEALGFIVDSCVSLKVLKLFGCSQITKVFLDGHSNQQVQIVGLKMTPILEHLKVPDPLEGPLHYSSVFTAIDPCLVS